MFTISYNILPENLRITNNNLSMTDVEYYLFPGDILWKTDSGDIDMSWGWIPLLDYALAFRNICKSLSRKESGKDEFGFTENDEYILLRKSAHVIEITFSFDNNILRVDCDEFFNEVNRFCASLMQDILDANPHLLRNETFQEIIKQV